MQINDVKDFIGSTEGKTQKGLGEALGHGDPTIISKVLGGKRELRIDEIVALIEYTESDYVIFNNVISFKLPENLDEADFSSVAFFIAELGKKVEKDKVSK